MKKQKVVMRVGMGDAKKRSKALQVIAESSGVSSVGIEGEDNDQIVVVGEMDSVTLTRRLRKQMGYVDLISVISLEEEEKKKKKEEEEKKKKEEEEEEEKKKRREEEMKLLNFGYPSQSLPYLYEVADNQQICCSIM